MSKNSKPKQIWTVIHPDKGMLVVCPECKVVPQQYKQKHCHGCGVELGWENIYIVDVKKEAEANADQQQQDNQENISEDK